MRGEHRRRADWTAMMVADSGRQVVRRKGLWELIGEGLHRPTRRRVVALLLSATYLLAMSPFVDRTDDTGDEGIYLHYGERVRQGEVPYRDFQMYVLPGTVFLNAMMFWICGIHVEPVRVTFWCAMAALAYLVARTCLRQMGLFAAMAAVAMLAGVSFIWPVATHHWYGTILAFAGMYVLINRTSVRSCSLAGLLLFLSLIFHQLRGAVMVIAALVTVTVARRQNRLAATLSLLGGLLVPLFVTVVVGMTGGAWSKSVGTCFGWTTTCYTAFASCGYFYPGIRHQLALQWWRPTSVFQHLRVAINALCLGWLYALPAVMIVGSISGCVRGRRWHGGVSRRTWLILMSFGVAAAASVVFRLAVEQLSTVMVFWIVPSVLFIGQTARLSGSPLLCKALRSVLCILLIAFVMRTAGRILTMRRDSYPVVSPRGVLFCGDRHKANRDNALVDFLACESRQGATAFIYPHGSIFLFLSGMPNPTRYAYCPRPMQTRDRIEQIIRELEEGTVPLVVIDKTWSDSKWQFIYPALCVHPKGQLLLLEYISAKYDLERDFDGLCVYRRRKRQAVTMDGGQSQDPTPDLVDHVVPATPAGELAPT